MKPLYTFLPAKAIPFWKSFPKNRRFPSGDGADAGGCAETAARTRGDAQQRRRGRGRDAKRRRRGCGGMHSDGGADAPERCLPRPPCPSSARGTPCPSSAAARHARHPHAARHARHPPRPAVPVIRTRPAMPVIRRGPPCPSSARGTSCPSSAAARRARHPPRPAMPVIHRRPPCPSSAAARHIRYPPRPAVPVIRRGPPCPSSARGPPSAARAAQTKKAPRGARDVFSDAARARAHTRRAGREKFFRCCAGAYAPPAGASGSVTSPIFSMRSSLTAVRPLRSA